MVVAVVGHQDPTHPPDAELAAKTIDKSEALAHESVVDQGLLGLAQARYVAFHRAAAG